jgi:hypothetical protein
LGLEIYAKKHYNRNKTTGGDKRCLNQDQKD